MDYVLLVFLAIVSSAVSIFLLRLHRPDTEPPADKETEEKPAPDGEEAEPDDGADDTAEKIYFAVMIVVNIAAACFMRWQYQNDILTIANALALLAVLWPCAWIDGKSFVIPNRILLIGLALRVLLICLTALVTPRDLGFILLRCGIAAAALLVVSLLCRLVSPGAVGFGDIKLMMLIGLFLGADRIWGAMLLSMIISFFYSLFLVVFKKATRKTELPFAPLLLIGTLLSLFLTTV